MANLFWDQELINKYNLSGPRYTSYPTALEFKEGYGEAEFVAVLNKYPERPLSLYFHIPFCHTLCYFCACNKVITRHKEKADRYLDVLELEIKHRASQVGNRPVTQLHLGGGTPTYLLEDQMRRLMAMIHEHFTFAEDCEIGIEIDPRRIELDYMDMLAELGFNRISIGIQDFDPEVQKAVNRVQDKDFILALIQRARSLGIESINLDLIYGLPLQTVESFSQTLDQVIELDADRLSVFNYAHLPARVPGQAKIDESQLPSAATKLAMFANSIDKLTNAGMVFIGMDHFAKPDNELAVAQRNGVLHRNFQGYTTWGEADLIGMGMSSISMVGDSYAQNAKTIQDYYQLVEQTNGSAIIKGFSLSADDCLRRDIIKQIICNFELDYAQVEELYPQVKFEEYFASEIKLLQQFADDKILEFTERGFKIPERGKLFVRHICMIFDVYSNVKRQSFSKIL